MKAKRINSDYITNTEKGFPKKIFWKVVAGTSLTEAQSYDLVFNQKDYDFLMKL